MSPVSRCLAGVCSAALYLSASAAMAGQTVQHVDPKSCKNCHEEILKSGLASLLNQRNYKCIVLLYSYMTDSELLPKMKDAWAKYIYEKGMYYLKNIKPTRESVMDVVGQIIDLKILTDQVIEDCFQNDLALRNA